MAITFTLLRTLGLGSQILSRISDALDPSTFDPAFYRDNFVGQGTCGGNKQSPIQLPGAGGFASALGADRVTSFNMPTAITGAKIENKGTGMQISWDPLQFDLTRDEFPVVQVAAGATGIASSLETYNPAAPAPVERTLTMIPVQMHWHVVSEHTLDGKYAAVETHIVTFVAPNQATEWGCDGVWENGGTPNLQNCIAVFGVTYELGGSTPAYLQNTINTYNGGGLSQFGNSASYPGTLDLSAVLPPVKSHYTYTGSLTTPPCAETLLWHVFDQPLTVTADAQIALEQMIAQTSDGVNPSVKNDYRHNNRPVQPLLGRTVYFST